MRLEQPGLRRLQRAVTCHPFIAPDTRDRTAVDFQRVFTRVAGEAYTFFTRSLDPAAIAGLRGRMTDDLAILLVRRHRASQGVS